MAEQHSCKVCEQDCACDIGASWPAECTCEHAGFVDDDLAAIPLERLRAEIVRREAGERKHSIARKRQEAVLEIVSLRDAGQITPWSKLLPHRSWIRTRADEPDMYFMAVSGTRYAVVWEITSPILNQHVVLAAGCHYCAGDDDMGYDRAMEQADQALARINPLKPETFCPVLSSDDAHLLWRRLDISDTEEESVERYESIEMRG